MIERQHVIPQFYLNYFCPGWVYQRGQNEPRWIATPSDEAVHSKYYGELDRLNNEIEGKGAPIYRKLVESPQCIEAEDEQFVLALLFANLFLRNPDYIEEWRAVRARATEQIIARLRTMLHPDSDASHLLIQLNREYGHLTAKGGHRLSVGDSFGALLDVAECIHGMSFFIWEAPENHCFLTSERPLLLEGHWAEPTAIAAIALCPTHILIMKHHEPCSISVLTATPEQVGKLNLDTIRNAKHKIYSTFLTPCACKWMKK